MADRANSTPTAVSRRFMLTSAASLPLAALPTAAPAAATATAAPAPTGELAALLARHCDADLRLQELAAEIAAGLARMPAWARPGVRPSGEPCRWPEWRRSELAAHGLPGTMPPRMSLGDLEELHRQSLREAPADFAALEERHRARVNAWIAKRHRQRTWGRRLGIDRLRRQVNEIAFLKHGIERAILDLLTAGRFDA
ncbi:hypothetical protein JL100_019570 [Skermanella mucosa]|uniref:hypothetical protein n=1 Tax=Skermanella mucosa TaxID=1789672 RepID=UPI00192B206A|nr:hypothetical protein [Skermanella mucosa]UEM19281.1 hypothetical protein JL100_019570 [Skermanella mucosa]